MPLSRRVARVNRVATNRVLGPLARRVPGFGVVHHRGRRSGQPYRTPVNVFRRPDGYVVALTYGSGADWVRNVLAAGGCELETRGRVEHLGRPRIHVDPEMSGLPRVVRAVLRANHVHELLSLGTTG